MRHSWMHSAPSWTCARVRAVCAVCVCVYHVRMCLHVRVCVWCMCVFMCVCVYHVHLCLHVCVCVCMCTMCTTVSVIMRVCVHIE